VKIHETKIFLKILRCILLCINKKLIYVSLYKQQLKNTKKKQKNTNKNNINNNKNKE